jgi:hypothetical protein
MNSWYHAKSASSHWGGLPEDYLPIEEFIDGSKQSYGDVRHRAMYHHTQGIWLCERIFGATITVQKEHNSLQVPVREIAERHILEDLGRIPSPGDWLNAMNIQGWMSGAQQKFIGREALFTGNIKEGSR